MSARPVLVIVGVDAVGKTTVAQALRAAGHRVIARSDSNTFVHPAINAKMIDELTLNPTFSHHFKSGVAAIPTHIDVDGCITPVYYLMLDAPLSVLEERLNARPHRDIWETPKAMFYFWHRFRQLAHYCGWPLIDTTGSIEQTLIKIDTAIARYHDYSQLAVQQLSRAKVNTLDWEQWLFTQTDLSLPQYQPDKLTADIVAKMHLSPAQEYELNRRMSIRAAVRDRDIVTTLPQPPHGHLLLVNEGESKKIYRVHGLAGYEDVCVIVLKNTIYSHSRQSTCDIDGLGAIRAVGTQIFLDMMYRSGSRHCYRALNDDGIIVADYLPDCAPLEVVYKAECVGTDKHSFYGLTTDTRMTNHGQYTNGGYVRFDYRNPNHTTIIDGVRINPMESPHYYVVEAIVGKNDFFKNYLTTLQPWGDKVLPEALASTYINLAMARREVIKVCHTILHYFACIGLKMVDVCFMMSQSGTFWSEINTDCMRIQAQDGSTSYDKDIWRAGGSSAEDNVKAKWTTFNRLMSEYLLTHPFADTDMLAHESYGYQDSIQRHLAQPHVQPTPDMMCLYKNLLHGSEHRRIIATLDLWSGQPVTVERGAVKTAHSPSIEVAFDKIGLFTDILTVDLNGAIDGQRLNAAVIKRLAQEHYTFVGGGLHTVADVEDILSSSARRVVIGSAWHLLPIIPPARLIVELTVNEHNHILIDGRKTNTGILFRDKVAEMASLGVEAISVTFHHTEGLLQGLPREQIRQLVLAVPKNITKIIVAGGISCMEDLIFCWRLPRVIPQLGSAIWKNRLSPGQIMAAMCDYKNDGCIPAIIQNKQGAVLGQVFLNEEAVIKSVQERRLWRYSRKMGRLSLKGETSGQFQRILKMCPDCDNDSLLITVADDNNFCHRGNTSCYSLQTSIKTNLETLSGHLAKSRFGSSFSGQMQQTPALALMKMQEELKELVSTDAAGQVHECADVMLNFLLYCNGSNIPLSAVANELNARRWDPRLTLKPQKPKRCDNNIILAVTGTKYTQKTDDFCRDELGIRVLRPTGRSLHVGVDIVDVAKYQHYFGQRQVALVPMRPKDIAESFFLGYIDGAITYNTVLDNGPRIMAPLKVVPDNTVRLCLIQRQDDTVVFGGENKIMLAAEHTSHVQEYLRSHNIKDTTYSIHSVLGASEAYLVGMKSYSLCDAVVESGATLAANNLKIHSIILDYGQVTVGLYGNLRGELRPPLQ